MVAEDVHVAGGPVPQQVQEEGVQLAACDPRGAFGKRAVQAEACNKHSLYEVHDVGPRDHFARGKVETVVLDKRHAILVHFEDYRVVRPFQQQVAYDLSDVGYVGGVDEVAGTCNQEAGVRMVNGNPREVGNVQV